MANQSRDKKNQPPTGESKEQSPNEGAAQKLDKRSDVLQADRNHPESNIGTDEDEAAQTQDMDVPQKRERAGR